MLLATQARKAGYLARSGDEAGARALFGEVVDKSAGIADSGTALRELLAPYFALLARDGSADAAARMFRASQALQRPGVAQTQAVLARQLSEGDDEASAMFRLAVSRTREIVRTEAEIARLSTEAERRPPATSRTSRRPSPASRPCAPTRRSCRPSSPTIPRYKVLAPQQTELDDGARRASPGRGLLQDDGDRRSPLRHLRDPRHGARLPARADAPADGQGRRRACATRIVRIENDQAVTDPFDAVRARKLYLQLFGADRRRGPGPEASGVRA